MKAKDLWNNILIVLTIFAIGCLLIVSAVPRVHGDRHKQQIRAREIGSRWSSGSPTCSASSSPATVTDLRRHLGKAPFSDIGAVQDNKRKHPPWVDTMLKPLGYLLFLAE